MNRSMQLKESKVSSEAVFSGSFLNVCRDVVTLPNGKQATREFVKHPGAVAIVPVNEKGQILMVRQFRYPLGIEMLEVPAGKLDPGETPDVCAARELAEETGFRPGNLHKLGPIHTTPGFSDEIIHLYLAEKLVASPEKPDEDEFLQVEAYSIDRLKQMIADGVISDAKTIIALFWAFIKLETIA